VLQRSRNRPNESATPSRLPVSRASPNAHDVSKEWSLNRRHPARLGLLYAKVVKSYRRRRIVGVKHRVIFGATETIESILAKRGWKINTALIERLNLDFRQHVAAIGRRVNTLCKHEAGLRQQLAIFHTYHNFVLPHASLRLPLPELMDAVKSGKRWQPRTPAMAAGLTDRVWSLREVLRYRVPPWPQPQVH